MCFLLSLELPALHAGLAEQITNRLGKMIFALINHFLESRINNHLGAQQARADRGVQRSPAHGDAVIRGLNDRVFLRVRADAVAEVYTRRGIARTSRTAALKTVFDSARRAVVTGGDDSFFKDNQRRDLSATAVTPLRNNVGDIEEVSVPVRTFQFLGSKMHFLNLNFFILRFKFPIRV